MYHVALVNLSDKIIEYPETYETEEEAKARLHAFRIQAELNWAGCGTCEAGKEWGVYGPAAEPFAFPAEAVQ